MEADKIERCEICGRSAEYGPICAGCAKEAAHLLLSDPSTMLATVWRGALQAAEPNAARRPAETGAGTETARAHADLAHAFLDMGMGLDALLHAARAILDPGSRRDSMRDAITVFLDERLGGRKVTERLREVLRKR